MPPLAVGGAEVVGLLQLEQRQRPSQLQWLGQGQPGLLTSRSSHWPHSVGARLQCFFHDVSDYVEMAAGVAASTQWAVTNKKIGLLKAL